nr:immunoglobulin heavy chain junction region [Macaca mulatta]MOW77426.1 immunoglobulin heavy chain junction region [Macaca mulatta]
CARTDLQRLHLIFFDYW